MTDPELRLQAQYKIGELDFRPLTTIAHDIACGLARTGAMDAMESGKKYKLEATLTRTDDSIMCHTLTLAKDQETQNG